MRDMRDMDEPLNAEERYLHGVNTRLNIIIEMLSSVVSFIAHQNNIAITENKVVEKQIEVIEEVEVVEEVIPRKRRTNKKVGE